MNTTINFEFYDDVYELGFYQSAYRNNNNLYVGLVDMKDHEMFGDVTKNIINLTGNLGAIDTNNLPGIDRALINAGLATDTGMTVPSGYCEYPVLDLTPLIERLSQEESVVNMY